MKRLWLDAVTVAEYGIDMGVLVDALAADHRISAEIARYEIRNMITRGILQLGSDLCTITRGPKAIISNVWYYLEKDGGLHWSHTPLNPCSPNIRGQWHVDLTNRFSAWHMVIEALALGADLQRINQLQGRWHLTDADAHHYLDTLARAGSNVNLTTGTIARAKQGEHVGYGPTALHALANLLREQRFDHQDPELET